jgi:hypothetical protein
VDRRFAGLDRSTILPSLLVLALAVLMSIVLPATDSRTDYRDAIRAGEVVKLGGGIILVPTPGWTLATGALAGRTRSPIGSTAATELDAGSVRLYVQAAPFTRSPSALLSRINTIDAKLAHMRGRTAATGRRYPVTTARGAVGVGEDFAGIAREGSVIAFVFDRRASTRTSQSAGEGLEVVVSGPAAALSRRRDEIVAMIRSIRGAA